MNYGKGLAYILMAGGGMMLICIGIAYKTGYFPGHSETGAYIIMAIGAVLTLLGLSKMRKI